MRDKILRLIDQYRLLENGDQVIAAVSGGADSVALLHILVSIKEKFDLKVTALHFHHMIRGEEADRDERFVRELCQRLGVPYRMGKADVPAIAARTGESLEECGRRLRYACLNDYADDLGGAKIATAHHRNDNTETVLMNLVRGAGIAGLGGIPVQRDSIIRPLLNCSRQEIEAYCAENDLSYVTDSTNLDDSYTRNRLRLNILPQLRELNPSLDEAILRTANVMQDADAYLNKISKKELKQCKTDYGCRCDQLLALDKAVLSYAVKNLLEEAHAPVDSLHIRLIIEAMRDGGSVDLGAGFRAVCAQGILRITDGGVQNEDFCIPFAEYCRIADVKRLDHAQITDKNGKIHKKFLNHCIPCAIISDDTVVRCRRARDTFTDARRGVTKTLKKLLNEMKIPRELRDHLIVIAQGSTVLWLQGVGTSKQAQIGCDDADEVYLIEEKGIKDIF